MRKLIFGLSLVLSLAACGGSSHLTPPPNFLELHEDQNGYRQRATSAQGIVVASREVDNERHGTLAFWLDAIKQRMRGVRGYALTEEKDVRAASGETGKQLRFGHDEAGGPFVYWLTVFVTHDHIYIVEAGGKKELFDRSQPQVEQAIAAFRLH